MNTFDPSRVCRRCAGRTLRCGAMLVVLLLASGCAVFGGHGPPPPSAAEADAAAAAHAAAVAAFENWRLSGRIGVQRDDQGFSADLEWRQHGAVFDLRITAPLNGGTFALNGDNTLVSLSMPDGQVYRAASAEALMDTHLGWTIPVSGARYWVRGIPAPRTTPSQERRDAVGRWTDFAQDGWRISILDYLDGGTPELPRKLFLARDTLKVRVVVRSWEPR